MIVVGTVFSAIVLSYDLYLWIKAKLQARRHQQVIENESRPNNFEET